MNPSPIRAAVMGGLLAAFLVLVTWLASQPAAPAGCQTFFGSSQPLLLLVALVPVGAGLGALVGRKRAPEVQFLGVLALLTAALGALVVKGHTALEAACQGGPIVDGGHVLKSADKPVDEAATDTFDRVEDLIARAFPPGADAGVAATTAADQVKKNRPGGPAAGANAGPGRPTTTTQPDGGPETTPDSGPRLDAGQGTAEDGGPEKPTQPRKHPSTGSNSIDPALQAALLAACLAASEGNAAVCAIFGSLLNLGVGGNDTKIEWKQDPTTGLRLPTIGGKPVDRYLEEKKAEAKKQCDVLPEAERQACKEQIDGYVNAIQNKDLWRQLMKQLEVEGGPLLDTIEIASGQCKGQLEPKEAIYLGCCARTLMKEPSFCGLVEEGTPDAKTFLDSCVTQGVQNVQFDQAYADSFLTIARAMCKRQR